MNRGMDFSAMHGYSNVDGHLNNGIHSRNCWYSVCCSALQCVAVCCNVMQCVAVCCSALQCVAVSKLLVHSMLQCVTMRRSVLQCVAVCFSALQCVAVCCNALLQCVAVCYSALQCITVRCSMHYINNGRHHRNCWYAFSREKFQQTKKTKKHSWPQQWDASFRLLVHILKRAL